MSVTAVPGVLLRHVQQNPQLMLPNLLGENTGPFFVQLTSAFGSIACVLRSFILKLLLGPVASLVGENDGGDESANGDGDGYETPPCLDLLCPGDCGYGLIGSIAGGGNHGV